MVIYFFNEYVHSYMYYLCMCNELYSVSNCIDYARSGFMTRHVNIIYIILGSPEINGNLFFIMNMYIHICIIDACAMNCTQSPTVLITHGQPCSTSCKHYTYNIILYHIMILYV